MIVDNSVSMRTRSSPLVRMTWGKLERAGRI